MIFQESCKNSRHSEQSGISQSTQKSKNGISTDSQLQHDEVIVNLKQFASGTGGSSSGIATVLIVVMPAIATMVVWVTTGQNPHNSHRSHGNPKPL